MILASSSMSSHAIPLECCPRILPWNDIKITVDSQFVKSMFLKFGIPFADMHTSTYTSTFQFSSVQFICSVVSNSLWLHGLQHTKSPCPSPIPRVYSNSCPLNQWCHPTISSSSSVIPFASHLQSFPASGSFQMSQLFASSGQSIRVSASTSVLPMNIQDWFPLRLIGWISLQSKGLSRGFSNTTVQKHQFFSAQLSL